MKIIENLKFLTLSLLVCSSISGCSDDDHKSKDAILRKPDYVGQWYQTNKDDCRILTIYMKDSITSLEMKDGLIQKKIRGTYTATKKGRMDYVLSDGSRFKGSYFVEDSLLVLTEDVEDTNTYNRIADGFSIKNTQWKYESVEYNIKSEKGVSIPLPDGIEFNGRNSINTSEIDGDAFIKGMPGLVAELNFLTDTKVQHTFIKDDNTAQAVRKSYSFKNNILEMSFSQKAPEAIYDAVVVPAHKAQNKKEGIVVLFSKKSSIRLFLDVALSGRYGNDFKIPEKDMDSIRNRLEEAFDDFSVSLHMRNK